MGRLYTQSKAVINQLARDMNALALKTASDGLAASNKIIMENPGAEGVALGPAEREGDVAASAYIASAGSSGYDEAKAAMAGGSDAKRGQYADPAKIVQGPNEVRVKVAYAAGRAALMHEGYDDYRGHKMAGVEFLKTGVEAQWAKFQQGAQMALRRTQNIHAMGSAERERQKRENAEIQGARVPDPYYAAAGRYGDFFRRAGVDPGNIGRVMDDMMQNEGGHRNINRAINNTRRNQHGERMAEATPYNPQEGWKRQKIYDRASDKIRWESDDEYIDRIAEYYSRLGDVYGNS